MATTTNFGWETPDDTDLVKDGAAAIRTALGGVDTSFVDLKGGTTGQVLSKASNTDLDYTWVTTDDTNAIQNAIVDAKGDLIAASAADTPARLAVGSNGETLVADSSTATGLDWKSAAEQYPWQTWTPTYSGITVGNGTVVARYQQIGKTVNLYYSLVWGSTTSYTIYGTFTLPVNSVYKDYVTGQVVFINAGVEIYTGQTWMEQNNRAYFTTNTTSGSYSKWEPATGTIPFTSGTGDIWTLTATYEAV